MNDEEWGLMAEDFVRSLKELKARVRKLCRELQRLDERLGRQIKLVEEGENGERGA